MLSEGTLKFDNNSTAGNNNTIGYSNRGGAIVFNGSSAIFENQDNGSITFINGRAGNSVIANNVGAVTVTFGGTISPDNAAIRRRSIPKLDSIAVYCVPR